jgi:hypothetical protein
LGFIFNAVYVSYVVILTKNGLGYFLGDLLKIVLLHWAKFVNQDRFSTYRLLGARYNYLNYENRIVVKP